jgi:hypothetical protein
LKQPCRSVLLYGRKPAPEYDCHKRPNLA